MLQLKKFRDIPVSTGEEARESRPHAEEPHFRLLAREKGSFPCVFGKEFLAFPSHLKRRRSPQERREELQGRATIPRVTQMSQSIPEKPVFPALPRLSIRASTHTTVALGQRCGKASWEGLVGKPRGKATFPFTHAKGSATLLLQLGRKAHVHAPTRDEDLLPWGDSRITPRSMSAVERNPQVPAPTPHKVLGPGIDWRGIPRGPGATRMWTRLSKATRAGSLGSGRKSIAPAATRDNPRGSPLQAR